MKHCKTTRKKCLISHSLKLLGDYSEEYNKKAEKEKEKQKRSSGMVICVFKRLFKVK